MPNEYDIAVVGGGIVGLAATLALAKKNPRLRLVVLEKEQAVAAHQTGHNSGVIHSGIYYKPGSLKAQLCVSGARQMIEFCQENDIPFQRCGKVVVATGESELPRLEDLARRAAANGVPGVEQIGPERLREIEPHAAGLCALYSPGTSIVDYREAAAAMRGQLEKRGNPVQTSARVIRVINCTGGLAIRTERDEIAARHLINCAGLQADLIAELCGVAPQMRIVPFRGEYYLIRPGRRDLVRGLIYPVADPRLPFLGVHLTRTIHGEVEAGPNAVLAFSREGYTLGRVNPGELVRTLAYPGFWRMARRFWQTGLYEYYRSFSPAAFADSLRRLVPDLGRDDLVRGGAGVRAQGLSPNGELVDDFRIVANANSLHVLNAPSPAATASLAIGQYIAARAQECFDLRD